jgi:hypothetical protein
MYSKVVLKLAVVAVFKTEDHCRMHVQQKIPWNFGNDRHRSYQAIDSMLM